MPQTTMKEMWPDVVGGSDPLGIELSFDSAWPSTAKATSRNADSFDQLDEDGWNVYEKHLGDEWSWLTQGNKDTVVKTFPSRPQLNLDELRGDLETPRTETRSISSKISSNQEHVSTFISRKTANRSQSPLATNATTKIRPPPAPHVSFRNKVRHFITNKKKGSSKLNTITKLVDKDEKRDDVTVLTPFPPASPSPLRLPFTNNPVDIEKIFRRSVRQLDEFCSKGSDSEKLECMKRIDNSDKEALSPLTTDSRFTTALPFNSSVSPPLYPNRIIFHHGHGLRADPKSTIKKENRNQEKVLANRNVNNIIDGLPSATSSIHKVAFNRIKNCNDKIVVGHAGEEETENIEKVEIQVSELPNEVVVDLNEGSVPVVTESTQKPAVYHDVKTRSIGYYARKAGSQNNEKDRIQDRSLPNTKSNCDDRSPRLSDSVQMSIHNDARKKIIAIQACNTGSENIDHAEAHVLLIPERNQRTPTGDLIADRRQWLMEAFTSRDQIKDKVEGVTAAHLTQVVSSKIDKKTTDMFGGQVKTKSTVQRRREDYERKLEQQKASLNSPKLMAKTQWENNSDGTYRKRIVTVTTNE